MRTRLIVAATAMLAIALPSARAQTMIVTDSGRTIVTATGQARMVMAPDRATVTILLEPQAMSIEEAGNRLVSVERAVLDTLRRFNLPAGSVQTFNSGVAPYRSNMSPTSTTATFSGRSSVRVELREVGLLAAIAGAALAKGATFVSPPVFTVSTHDSVRRTLLPMAFQNARLEAEALATAAGGRLGRLMDLSAGGANFNQSEQMQLAFSSNMMYDNGQRVNPVTTVNVTVTTRWLLVPGR